ncbi:hypothetical protein HAX54_033789 [Datura stramonium]|uniref:Uncharacterized protein n=1 Tax=Datura stramonium TaxID=4076 RepID=A0ABS8VG33_DATST|nr:hypothetical protein [Datura stramonium]
MLPTLSNCTEVPFYRSFYFFGYKVDFKRQFYSASASFHLPTPFLLLIVESVGEDMIEVYEEKMQRIQVQFGWSFAE